MNIKFDANSLELKLAMNESEYVYNNSQEYMLNNGIYNHIDRFRIEVTLDCDLNCDYCIVFRNSIECKTRQMNMDVAKKIVSRFNREINKNGSIMIIGGEPLINWDVVQYIVKETKGFILFFTNGLKLDDDKIKFLRDFNVMIFLSLDGSTFNHNKLRFKNIDNYHTVINNIKRSVKLDANIAINCVVHEGNMNNIIEIANHYKNNFGVRVMSFAYPHHVLNTKKMNSFSIEKYTDEIIRLIKYSKENNIYVDQLGKIFRAILIRKPIVNSCKVGFSQTTFYPDGKETDCMKLDKYIQNSSSNNILDTFKANIPILNNKCKYCIAVKLCGGGCPWDSVFNNSEKGIDDRVCFYNKALVRAIIEDINEEISNYNNFEMASKRIKDIYLPLTKV